MMQPNPMLALSSALGFSAADLYANRAGVLTPRQRDYLLSLRNHTFEYWFLGVLSLLVGSIFFHLRLVVILFGLACMVTLLLVIWLRYEQDLQAQVQTLSGRPDFRQGVWLPGGGCRILIGGETFRVSRRIKAAFSGKAQYRVYYTGGTHTLLAAELSR